MTYREIEITELLLADVIVTADKNSPISATIRSLTGSSLNRAVFFISVLFSLLVLSGCGTINRWRSTTPAIVSDSIEIGSEWVEIIPPTPLISRSGTDQEILVYTEHDVDSDFGKDMKTLELKDGRTTKIEVYLYGEDGTEYELFINGDGGGAIWFARIPPNNKQGMIYFPNGKYTKLKVRSEIPIKVEKIEWKAGYTLDQL